MNERKPKTRYTTFNLPAEFRDLLQQIAEIDNRSMTNAMETLIIQKARELKLIDGVPGRASQLQN